MTTTDWLLGILTLVSTYSIVVTIALMVRHQRSPFSSASIHPVSNRVNMGVSFEKELRFKQTVDDALRLTQTFQKFVPKQFIDHITEAGSDNLELGYADEDEVAILFCDIRGFTGLSEKMPPQELMSFLNAYFLRMNDPIHQHQGFIDKFIGDAIMALFDHPGGTAKDKAIDALRAAIDLRKVLDINNLHRKNSGFPPINVGIGIHFGPVIMGTVGSDDRMDTTVIGDSVNIACRLETLTAKYGADIIISAHMLDTIGTDYSVKTRLLDWVRVKGRNAPIEIYEVLCHLSSEEQHRRARVQPHITAGLTCRIQQRWDEAEAHFKQALSIHPGNCLAQHHIDVCRAYRSMDLGSNWDGALTIQ